MANENDKSRGDWCSSKIASMATIHCLLHNIGYNFLWEIIMMKISFLTRIPSTLKRPVSHIHSCKQHPDSGAKMQSNSFRLFNMGKMVGHAHNSFAQGSDRLALSFVSWFLTSDEINLISKETTI